MKKVLSIALTALLLCGLAACKGKEPTVDPADTAPATEDIAEDIDAEPADESEASAEEDGRIMRYGITVPSEVPEFDEEFYSQPVEYYTDDVLAANRDKLDVVPDALNNAIVNRFTEYLNAAEPGEHTDHVRMTWFYVNMYSGEDNETEYYRLVQVPFPVFEGGSEQAVNYSVTGAQNMVVRNASRTNNGTGAIDGVTVDIDSDSWVFGTAEQALEAFEDSKHEGIDNTLYMDYDADSKTAVHINHVVRDNVYDCSRDCQIVQTIAEGCGSGGNDILLRIIIGMEGDPELSEADVQVLRDYFEYMGVKFPDDAAMNIQ